MIPDAGLMAGRFLSPERPGLDGMVEDMSEGVLLLGGELQIMEASRAAVRLLRALGTLVPGLGGNFARALKSAVLDGRIRAHAGRVEDWLSGLRDGAAGDIEVEGPDGALLRLGGRKLTNGEIVVTVADVTAARRREQWLEIECHRLNTAVEELRRRIASLQSGWLDAETRVVVAETRADELERLAFNDPLTGLLNRYRLTELATAEISRCRRHGRCLSLLMLDLDRFKLVNDRLGHAAGDAALRQVALTCAATLRKGDLLGRWGGEEFVALLPETDAAGARHLAERLRAAVGTQSVCQDNVSMQITVSIGVAELTPEDEELSNLLARADEALYAAKQAGRNLVLAAA